MNIFDFILKNQKSKIDSKNSQKFINEELKKEKNIGIWTKEEEKIFIKKLRLFYKGLITMRELSSSIPTRTKKQVLSHFNKLKYKFDKKYGHLVSDKKKYLLEMKEAFREEKQYEIGKPLEYLQFYDHVRSTGLTIPLSILEIIKDCQHIKNIDDNENITIRLDENILKTICMKRIFQIALKNSTTPNKSEKIHLDQITSDDKSKVVSSNFKTSENNDERSTSARNKNSQSFYIHPLQDDVNNFCFNTNFVMLDAENINLKYNNFNSVLSKQNMIDVSIGNNDYICNSKIKSFFENDAFEINVNNSNDFDIDLFESFLK